MQFNQAPSPRESSLGDAYDPTADYSVDDLCIHDNVLCKCITPISGGEAWNPEHWTETNVGDEIKAVNSKITGTWNSLTTPASADITLYNDSFSTSGFIVRGGLCFVHISMELSSAVGDTSKAIIPAGILPPSLKNTIKPPPWSSFGSNNAIAESLFQSGIVYIRNAGTNIRWNVSFVYPVNQ